jgi:hypothetical protein
MSELKTANAQEEGPGVFDSFEGSGFSQPYWLPLGTPSRSADPDIPNVEFWMNYKSTSRGDCPVLVQATEYAPEGRERISTNEAISWDWFAEDFILKSFSPHEAVWQAKLSSESVNCTGSGRGFNEDSDSLSYIHGAKLELEFQKGKVTFRVLAPKDQALILKHVGVTLIGTPLWSYEKKQR